jgi:hypothetical protein
MPTACDNIIKYGCGENKAYKYIATDISEIKHEKDNSFYLNELSNNPIYSRKRTFLINRVDSKNRNGSYFLESDNCFKELGSEDEPCECLDTTEDTSTGELSESYETIDSVIYFLDIVNNIKFFKTTKHTITFNNISNDLAAFREPWGTNYYLKFKIKDAIVNKKIEYKLIVKDIEETLYSEENSYKPYSEENPLILLYPNPPSLVLPLDEDIKNYGFYDYNAGGPGGDWDGLAKEDGGKDYYNPEWCRNLGINNDIDTYITETRLLHLLTIDKETFDLVIGLTYDAAQFPIFNAAVDFEGNIFISCIIENKLTYNKIFTNTGLQLSPEQFCDKIPLGTSNTLFMPISII